MVVSIIFFRTDFLSSINENQLQIDIAEIKDITTTKITVTTVLTDTKGHITTEDITENELLVQSCYLTVESHPSEVSN